MNFKVDFRGIAIKVRVRNVIVCIFEKQNCDNLIKEKNFIPKKSTLKADIFHYQKQ